MDSVDTIIHKRRIRAVVHHGEIMEMIAVHVARELRIPIEDFRARCTIELRREGDSKWQAAVESSIAMPGDGQHWPAF